MTDLTRETTTADRWRIVPAEVLPVVLLLVVGMFGTRGAGQRDYEHRDPDLLAFVLVLVAVGSLLFRLRRPAPTLVICGAAVVTYLAAGYPFGPILFTVPVAVWAVATRLELRRAVLWSGVMAAGLALAPVARFVGPGWQWLAFLAWATAALALVATPAAIGGAVRVRREAAAGVRAEQARRAASEEQLRMAQELHDVVGHGLAVIAMQAGVALHVLDRHPDKARESLEAIRSASQESLEGLRTELDLLRASGEDPAPRRPAPTIADIDVLVERIAAGGIDVRLEVGTAGLADLPAEVSTTAYRIVQESLTNVLRHAGAAGAWVRIAQRDGDLVVEVADSGTGSVAGFTEGTGITGMRARAESLGGRLDAGPDPAGGFVVLARLPWSGVPGLTR